MAKTRLRGHGRPAERLRLRERTGVGLALVGLMGVGAALRLRGLDAWLLSWDDLWHLQDALQPSLASLLGRNLQAQVHGPLHYLLLHGLAAVSSEPATLRWISLAPGLLLVPAAYLFGRSLLGVGAGLFLAAGAAFAFRLVAVSQTLRPYSAMLLWLTLALVCGWRIRREPSLRWRLGYAASASAAAFTQVAALVPLGTFALLGALERLRARDLRRAAAWTLSHALLLGPPALWGLVQLHSAAARSEAVGGDLERFVAHFWYFRSTFPDGPLDALARCTELLRFQFFPPDAATALSWSLVGVSAGGLAVLVGQRRWDVLALVLGVVGAGAVLGLLELFPFAPTRHTTYLVPFLLLPGAALAEALYRRIDGRAFAVLGVVALVLAVDLDPERARRPREDFDTRVADWDAVLNHLERHAGPRDVVIVNRVGMQLLNAKEWLGGAPLEHVDHASRHLRYPYDRWVLAGDEEHRWRGLRFWACDGAHEWSTWLVADEELRACLRALKERHPEGFERSWFLVEKPELFLVFTTPRPLAGLPPRSAARRVLAPLRTSPFWRLFFASQEALRTSTTGTFAVDWPELAAALRKAS